MLFSSGGGMCAIFPLVVEYVLFFSGGETSAIACYFPLVVECLLFSSGGETSAIFPLVVECVLLFLSWWKMC